MSFDGDGSVAERARRSCWPRARLCASARWKPRRTHRPGGSIARLARDGLSNPEIGIRLFISPHTVQSGLHKVFIKFGIRSRAQLDRVLPATRPPNPALVRRPVGAPPGRRLATRAVHRRCGRPPARPTLPA